MAAIVQHLHGDADRARESEAGQGRKAKLFISYSRADRPFATKMAEGLQNCGFPIPDRPQRDPCFRAVV